MMKTKYERPQRHNPYKLTIKQHVLPVASINRFVDGTGFVRVHDKARSKIRPAKPDDMIFCAKRAWDQRAEAGYMKGIEDAFQVLALKIIEGTASTIASTENTIVDNFYALWYMRARYKNSNIQEIQLNKVTGDPLTQDQEEFLEKKGIGFIREGGTMPVRQLNGIQIQRWIDAYTIGPLSSVRWGIIRAQEGHFIVPDVSSHTIIPLTPTLCLANGPDGTIVKQNVAEINRCLAGNSKDYFFANDFLKCPL